MGKEYNKKIIVIGLLAILFILIAAAAMVFITLSAGGDRYQEKIEAAQQYLDSGDYDSAIEMYAEAIKEDQTRADAYIGLSDAYVGKQDYVSADYVLQKAAGYVRTSEAENIRTKLQTLQAYIGDAGDSGQQLEEVSADTAENSESREETAAESESEPESEEEKMSEKVQEGIVADLCSYYWFYSNEMYWVECMSFEKDHTFSAMHPIGKTLTGEEWLDDPRLRSLEGFDYVSENIGEWDYTDGILSLTIYDKYSDRWPQDHASYRVMDLAEYGYPRGGISESFEPVLDYVWYIDTEATFCDGDILPASAMIPEARKGDVPVPAAEHETEKEPVDIFVKNVDSELRMRSIPDHSGDLVTVIYDEKMYYYGETGQGYGSDNKMHDWFYVTTETGYSGWVRSDYVKSAE